MEILKRASSQALLLAGVLLAGCAEGSDGIFTTGSLTGQTAAAEAKADPACTALAERIALLRKEGIPDKIAKAAAKHYRMTHADLTKADQLNKASAEFESRCSTVKLPITAEATPPAQPATKTAAKKAKAAPAAKATP
jgi:hypothetical protein